MNEGRDVHGDVDVTRGARAGGVSPSAAVDVGVIHGHTVPRTLACLQKRYVVQTRFLDDGRVAREGGRRRH